VQTINGIKADIVNIKQSGKTRNVGPNSKPCANRHAGYRIHLFIAYPVRMRAHYDNFIILNIVFYTRKSEWIWLVDLYLLKNILTPVFIVQSLPQVVAFNQFLASCRSDSCTITFLLYKTKNIHWNDLLSDHSLKTFVNVLRNLKNRQ